MGVLFCQGILNSRPGTLRQSSEATLLLYILFHLLLVSYILDSPPGYRLIILVIKAIKTLNWKCTQRRSVNHHIPKDVGWNASWVAVFQRWDGWKVRPAGVAPTVQTPASASPPLFTPVANKTLSISRECSLRSRFPFESCQIATWVKLAAFYLFPCPACAAGADILLLNSSGNGAEPLNWNPLSPYSIFSVYSMKTK